MTKILHAHYLYAYQNASCTWSNNNWLTHPFSFPHRYFFSPFSQHINFTLLRIDEFQHSTKQTYCNRITFLCVEKDEDQLYLHTNSATFCAR